jgi:alpha-1,6-mannosyltransferase
VRLSLSPAVGYGLLWVAFAGYLAVLRWSGRLSRRAVWAAIVFLLLAFACLPPILSADVYSYVDYARLGGLHGIDPYLRGPAAAPADPAFAHVAWPHTPSSYGPVFTLLSYPLAAVPVGVAVYLLKAISAAAVLGIAVIVSRLARRRGVDPLGAAAFVALNPLVLVHVVGGPHNDALAVLAMTLGVAAVLAARPAGAGVAFLFAAAIKVSAGIAAPFALLGVARPATGAEGGPARSGARGAGMMFGGALLAAAAIGLGAHLAFGWHWLHAFGLASADQSHTSHLSIPTTVARLVGIGKATVATAALALFAVLVAWLLVWTYRGGDWLRAAAWAATGLLLATSWLLPWYLIWPLPLVALSRDRNLKLVVLALSADQLVARIPL